MTSSLWPTICCPVGSLPTQAYNLQSHVVHSYHKLLHAVNSKNKLTSVMGGCAMGYL